MKQQTYKIKSKQTLLKAKSKRLRAFKLKVLVLVFLCIVGYYIARNISFNGFYNPFKASSYKNFVLNEVEVLGLDKLSYKHIIKITELNNVKNIWEVDLNSLREKLKSDSWIEEATITRILPSKIKISVKERKPKVIWLFKNKFYLVAENGFVIEKVSEDKLGLGYLLIIGENANKDYASLHEMLFHSKLLNQVLSIAKVGNRRWDLYLQGDVLIKLPEDEVEKSLEILSEIVKYSKNNLSIIDLRLIPDKIYIEYKHQD